MYRRLGKRSLDLSVSLLAVAMLAPLLLAIAFMSWLLIGTPVLFRQQRPGLRGKPFGLLKFRTMTIECDAQGTLLPDEQRMTRWGSFLRSTSLDELPELFNVIAGSMSLVGPRPLLMAYLARYSEEEQRRHEIKPGITGWAQIHGRNAISWSEKFALDCWYVEHVSLELDVRILLRTLIEVFRRKGIHAEGAATMPEFMGSRR